MEVCFLTWNYKIGAERGCVGARVTPVAAGVHSLILILTASMTYGRASIPACVCYLVKKNYFFVTFKPIRNGNSLSIVRLFKEWNLKLSCRFLIRIKVYARA